MKVLVLGGGVIGVTTAYYLAKDGHEVTVVERHPAAASETSYANAGLVAPAHAYAGASPKAPKILFKSLFMKDQALRLKLRADLRMWRWALRFLAQCTEERGEDQHPVQAAAVRLFRRTAQRGSWPTPASPMTALRRAISISIAPGRASRRASRTPPSCASRGWRCGCWTVTDSPGFEPALEPVKDRLAGGMHAPGDQSGDARMFTRNLAAWCAGHLGVHIEYDTRVTALVASGGSDRARGDGPGRSGRRCIRAGGGTRVSVPGRADRGRGCRSIPARAIRSRCRSDGRT